MNANRISDFVEYVTCAHENCPTKLSKAFRKWDGETPYSVHPIWCAMTILSETSLPVILRERGAMALFLHDVLEDTTAKLPDFTPTAVESLVKEMTFESSEQEMEEIWSKSDEVKLLKLYDKVSNLLDASWMKTEKREKYVAYVVRLYDHAQSIYGDLNIVRMARAIVG